MEYPGVSASCSTTRFPTVPEGTHLLCERKETTPLLCRQKEGTLSSLAFVRYLSDERFKARTDVEPRPRKHWTTVVEDGPRSA